MPTPTKGYMSCFVAVSVQKGTPLEFQSARVWGLAREEQAVLGWVPSGEHR
jgi:hypothetical protein